MQRILIEQFLRWEMEKSLGIIEENNEMVMEEAPKVSSGRVSLMDVINIRSVFEAPLRQTALKRINSILAVILFDQEDFDNCKGSHILNPIHWVLIRPESLFCVQYKDQ